MQSPPRPDPSSQRRTALALGLVGVGVALGIGLLDAALRGDPVGLVGLYRAHLANPALWAVDLMPILLVGLARPPAPAPAPPAPAPESRERQLEARIAALTTARDEARAASKAKSRFLASMSHELRTPLNAIIGYSEMMREDAADGVTLDPEDLSRVVTAARHLLQLINNVLDLSRIEVGKMSVVLEPLSVQAVVREVVATVGPLGEANGNRFDVRVPAQNVQVRGDAVRVRQILVNLLGNAFKFTERGTVSLVVRPEAMDGLAWVVFEVHDTGIGMKEEQLRQLFQDYAQGADVQRRFGGTGLGLALSQRLASLMGGQIEARSAPGEGSVFTLRLPAPDLSATELSSPDREAAPPMQTPGPTPAVRSRVLLVDDDPAASHLARRLQVAGVEVVHVVTVEGARRILDEFELVVTDPHADRGAGWELLEQLAESGPPVVGASVDDGDQERVRALGAVAWLPKPLDAPTVAATLARVTRS